MELSMISAGLRQAADQAGAATTEAAADHAASTAATLDDRMDAAAARLDRLQAERRLVAFKVETVGADRAELEALEEQIRAAQDDVARLHLAADVARENKAAADQAREHADLARRGRELLSAHGRFLTAVDQADAALDSLAAALGEMTDQANLMSGAVGGSWIAAALGARIKGVVPVAAALRCAPCLGPVAAFHEDGPLRRFFEQDASALASTYNSPSSAQAEIQAMLAAAEPQDETERA